MRQPILAIDGPAGAGKSTVARGVAERLGYTYIDTGAMYRAVAWTARQRGLMPDAASDLAALAAGLPIEFRMAGGRQRVLVGGEDVTEAIREPEIGSLASVISTHPGVRAALVRAQRAMGAPGGVVMEGRDIGTVVFPDAELKIYLDATVPERARRREGDLRRQGRRATLSQVRQEIEERDRRDSTRADSPLRQAPGAVHLMTDGLTVEAVIDRVTALVRERTAE
jgi:pantoate ligase/cytidylate kinase